jgi:uncharacterized membrane protein YfcA
MQIYLPIAEMAVNFWLMLGIGALVGIISGMFGIGGGFLLTPLLILVGIPAPIAVVSGANVSAAASMSSLMPQVERKTIDFRLALLMTVSGVIGVGVGSMIFKFLQNIGYADIMVKIAYVLLLGFVGISLLRESITSYLNSKNNVQTNPRDTRHKKSNIGYKLPLKMRFPRSKLFISILPPIALGFVIGILSALMGVGGGFLLIPALIYIVNMPPSLVVGTSAFQVLILASATSFVQGINSGGLDLVLAGVLILGAVVGAQIGSIIGRKIKGEELRILLGSIILLLALVIAGELFITPQQLFETSSAGGGL